MPVNEILVKLPKQFSRKDFIECVGMNTTYTRTHAQNLLEKAIYKRLISRVERGVYKQNKTTE